MSVSVHGTYTFPNFKGVKNLDPTLMKPKKDLTEEEIWARILGPGYQYPYCPDCHAQLVVSEFNLEYQMNSNYVIGNKTYYYTGFSWHVRYASPIIKVILFCPRCGVTIDCLGQTLTLENEAFYLESLYVVSVRRAMVWPLDTEEIKGSIKQQ